MYFLGNFFSHVQECVANSSVERNKIELEILINKEENFTQILRFTNFLDNYIYIDFFFFLRECCQSNINHQTYYKPHHAQKK